jgi:hypothetical protein
LNGVFSLDCYGYALDSPLKYTDPVGLCVDACVAEAAAIAGIMALASWYTVCTASQTCPWHTPPKPSCSDPLLPPLGAPKTKPITEVPSVPYAPDVPPMRPGENCEVVKDMCLGACAARGEGLGCKSKCWAQYFMCMLGG